MGIIIGIAAAGFLFVLVFFTKLNSLEPQVKAAVIGVRILLVIGVIVSSWLWNNHQKATGRNFFGDLDLTTETFIGQWRIEPISSDEIVNNSIYSFYKDSTFHSSPDKKRGKWLYISKTEKLYIHFANASNEFAINEFDGTTIKTKGHDTFIKISDSPQDSSSLKTNEDAFSKAELVEEPKQNIEKPVENNISSTAIEGKWSLKLVRNAGYSTEDKGTYEFSKDGSGTHNGEIPISFKFNRDKKRFTVSLPDEVILLNIKSYDGEVLIGYPNEEPDNKYVFTKAI